jgi:hypothetical protein
MSLTPKILTELKATIESGYKTLQAADIVSLSSLAI